MSQPQLNGRKFGPVAQAKAADIPEQKRAFTVEEFCSAYGIGKSTTWAEIKEERLRAVGCGRRVLIARDDAEAWLAALPARSSRNPVAEAA